MRRVVRRSITTDERGRALQGETERIADDGEGHVHAVVRRAATTCPACRRPVPDAAELRGRCDHCRLQLCTACASQCAVCRRNLCGRCRRGFVGSTALTVCPVCLVRLQERQAYDDRLRLQQIAFDRHLTEQREWAHLAALRLQAERVGLMADMQGLRVRFGLLAGTLRRRPFWWRALAKVWDYGRRLFR